ncbi:MAG: hypothetical protein ACK416_02555 [Zestosphaera sp.]
MSKEVSENEVKNKEISDVEELRGVLKAVSEFLIEIKEPLGDLIKMLVESVSGEKLAKEVSTFYKSLIESGVDQQTAKEWTDKFLNERLKSLPSLSFLKDLMSERFTKVERQEEEKD